MNTLLITGASSGIGASLARFYARPGTVLYLLGRDGERLEAIASLCREQGATVETASIDVRDRDSMARYIEEADARTPLGLVIANAGVSAGPGLSGETTEQTMRLFEINIGGVLNTVLPLLPRMQERKSGQIAIMSSLAGLRGLPSAPAYSASKNAVRAWGEALRGSLAADNIRVSVICPGYIKTPLTDGNPFPMPFLMDADKAARIIVSGLAKNRARIAFPLRLYVPVLLLAALPPSWTDWFFSRLPKKR